MREPSTTEIVAMAKELRRRTHQGVGLLWIKRALIATEYDVKRAEQWLREQGHV